MKSLTAEEAVKAFPALENLLLLREAGWKFLPVEEPDATGSVLDGARIWPQGWRDCIRVEEETDTLGLRMRMANDQHTVSEIAWELSGTLEEVVVALLALPAPGERTAPNLVIGRAPTLWTP